MSDDLHWKEQIQKINDNSKNKRRSALKGTNPKTTDDLHWEKPVQK